MKKRGKESQLVPWKSISLGLNFRPLQLQGKLTLHKLDKKLCRQLNIRAWIWPYHGNELTRFNRSGGTVLLMAKDIADNEEVEQRSGTKAVYFWTIILQLSKSCSASACTYQRVQLQHTQREKKRDEEGWVVFTVILPIVCGARLIVYLRTLAIKYTYVSSMCEYVELTWWW